MQKKKIELNFISAHFSEIEKKDQELIFNAKKAFESAYAPYSGFMVGASILLENGEIINGSNQENVAYPSGLCAERVAMFYVGARFPDVKINTIAVSVYSRNFEINDVISPCGACRQAIAEYEMKQELPIEIYFMGAEGKIIKSNSLANLLPFGFESSVL